MILYMDAVATSNVNMPLNVKRKQNMKRKNINAKCANWHYLRKFYSKCEKIRLTKCIKHFDSKCIKINAICANFILTLFVII